MEKREGFIVSNIAEEIELEVRLVAMSPTAYLLCPKKSMKDGKWYSVREVEIVGELKEIKVDWLTQKQQANNENEFYVTVKMPSKLAQAKGLIK